MNVLVVGSGGREHALAGKLSQSETLTELHAAPGNPGIAKLARCHPVRAEDREGMLSLAGVLGIDLVVVGPEAPLVAGLADELRHAGVAVFGPSRAAAMLEGSKSFAKEVMQAAAVPTAAALAGPRAPCVVKVDGLAGGKGVFVCRSDRELEAGLRSARAFGGRFLVEELLEGRELSLFALCDGQDAVPLQPARDYKRVGDGDTGPNTGGMGAFSPVPELGEHDVEEIVDTVHRPVVAELAARGTPFVGLLYAGLMLTQAGVRVLEFNCRFGDPETQAILPRLEDDLLPALAAAAAGRLGETTLRASREAAVTIVLAAGDYPAGGDAGAAIEGVSDAERVGALVFHAGTALQDGKLVTNGRRILNVTALGASLAEARDRAYAAAEQISFPGARYRGDIALAAAQAEDRVAI